MWRVQSYSITPSPLSTSFSASSKRDSEVGFQEGSKLNSCPKIDLHQKIIKILDVIFVQ